MVVGSMPRPTRHGQGVQNHQLLDELPDELMEIATGRILAQESPVRPSNDHVGKATAPLARGDQFRDRDARALNELPNLEFPSHVARGGLVARSS